MQTKQLLLPNGRSEEERVVSLKPVERYQTLLYQELGM